MTIGSRVIIETDRLRVRELAEGDLDFVAAMLADPDVTRYWGRTFDRDAARAWIDRQLGRYRSHGYGYWLALERATDEPVGQVGLLPTAVDGRDEAAIGYMIASPFWGRGLATEGAAACRDHGFDTAGCDRILTLIRPENERSHRVAARLGFRALREVDFAGFAHVLYAITRPERDALPQ